MKDLEKEKFLKGVDVDTTDDLKIDAIKRASAAFEGSYLEEYILRAIEAYEPEPEFSYEECCIKTFTGKYLNVFEPRPEDICIEDIAHGLAMQPRFGGQLPEFYSVAQHSVMVANLCWGQHKLAALLHDASEAYMADIPSPIKKRLRGYKKVENVLMKAIADKFGFQFPFDQQIKDADREMLIVEMDCLSRKRKRFPVAVHGQVWAEREFLNYFNSLR